MRHVRWRSRPVRKPPQFVGIQSDEAAALLAEALLKGHEWLGISECTRLLSCYGIAVPAWRADPRPIGAAAVAAEFGGRVVLKAQGPGILHKSEIGAVRVELVGEEEVARAAREMRDSLAGAGVEIDQFIVQRMVEGGVEVLVGVVTDPVFGPVLACGAGGTQAELLKDVAVRVCPLSPEEGMEMISSLAIFPLLEGYRGAPAADLGALEGLLLRVGAMVDAHQEIVELDLNPVVASSDGAVAVDARIRVRSAALERPWPRTWI